MRYATWEDVRRKFPLADRVVPIVTDQESLLDDKTAIFRAYTRNVRHAALTADAAGEFEALAREVVASLVAGELQKKHTPNQQLREMDFGFIQGAYTTREIDGYTIIAAIKRGDAVFEEDPALRDVILPEPIPGKTNTSTGVVIASLPVGYKALVPGIYIVECTTAGRVDNGTARFSVHFQNEATPLVVDLIPTSFPQHIRNEFYLTFRDGAVANPSFVQDDVWTVTCYPAETVANANGPREIGLFLS